MSGLGPWLRFSLIAWAIFTVVALMLAKEVKMPLLVIIGSGLLSAVFGGLFFDWVWSAVGGRSQLNETYEFV
jgi:hypothetical protein